MRKNYFAKKFVAYSMAFAVAFSTLTVSPVFVKEAKAAGVIKVDETLTQTVGYEIPATDAGYHGKLLVSAINTKLGTNSNLSVGDYKTFAEFSGTDNIVGSYVDGNVSILTSEFVSPSTDAVLSTKKPTLAPVAFSGTEFNKDSNPLGNINYKYTATSADGATWFKLLPQNKEITNIVNSTEEKLTVTYYELSKLDATNVSNVDSKDVVSFDEVNSDQTGIYVAIKDKAIVEAFNLKETSDMNPVATQKTVKSMVGDTAVLGIDVISTRPVTYTWTKNGVELGTDSTLKVSNIEKKDFGTYSCKVSDGLKSVTVPVSLLETKIGGTYAEATTIETYKNIIDGAIDTNATITVDTSIPANSNFAYVWYFEDASNNKTAVETFIPSASKVKFDASDREIVLFDDAHNALETKLNANDVVVVAVDKAQYAKVLKDELKAVADAPEYDKLTKVDTLLANTLTALGASKLTPLFTEKITIQDKAKKDASIVKVMNIGDALTLTAPKSTAVTPGYVWTGENDASLGTKNQQSLKFNTLGIDDFGTYKCEVSERTGGNTNYKVNIVYVSDFIANANEIVEAKVGAKDVAFEVNASAKLPISYEWGRSKNTEEMWTTAGVNEDDATTINKVELPEIVGTNPGKNSDKIFADFDSNGELTAASNAYTCTVTDGVYTKKFTFGVKQVQEFDVDEAGTTVAMKARKDSNVTLVPTVTATNAKALTYEWTKGNSSTVVSTDAVYTFKYDGTPVTYKVKITDGTEVANVTYTIALLDESTTDATPGQTDLDHVDADGCKVNVSDMVYTGSALNGNLSVIYDVGDNDLTDGADTTFILEKDKDYKVEYKENVNVGIARYTITYLGSFKGLNNAGVKALVEGSFFIDRADNKLEIADKTVMLGQSVQPTTVTNLSKGTLTYTYYADADCTTEIEVPNKVGTYYVKATSVATANYNEATSNVATIKIIGLGKTKIGSTSRTASSVKLPWTKVEGATKYRVYKKAAGASSYTKVADTTALSYNVKGLASATTYTFAVKAYGEGGWATVYATKTTTTAPAKVSTPVVTAKGSGKVAISYKKVARATGYQIYMAKGNGSYKKIAQGSKTAIIKASLAKGATYKFKVRAYKTVGSNTYYGAFSSAKAVVVK